MTNEQVEKVLVPTSFTKLVNISFKTRNNLRGMFIQTKDYEDLKAKNFWRVIAESRIEDWKKTNDMGLGRIYSGSDFTKLTVLP
jgi:hypothetical protein